MASRLKLSKRARSSTRRFRRSRLSLEGLEARQLLTTFYVDGNAGDDGNNGQSLGAAFETIQAAANAAIAGDTVLIRGGVYREAVNAPRSGSAGAPITFAAYNNEEVILSGADRVTGWTLAPSVGPDVWVANVGGDLNNNPDANTLFVGGDYKNEARQFAENDFFDIDDWAQIPSRQLPNSGFTLTSPDLVGFGDDYWNGATVNFNYYERTVVDYDSASGTVTFDEDLQSVAKNGWYFFYIDDTINALDKPGEWYKEGSSLYYQAAPGENPNNLDIEWKERPHAFNLNGRSHITLAGLTFRGASFQTDGGTDFLTLDSNRLYGYDAGDYGRLFFNGDNYTVVNNEFSETFNQTFSTTGDNHAVVNNYFHHIGLAPDRRVLGTTGGTDTAENFFFSYNTVRTFSRSVFDGYPARAEISYNLFEDGGALILDTGVLDSDGGNGNNSKALIHHNVFRGTDTHDIYMVYYGRNNNAVFHHNLIYDFESGALETFRAIGTDFRQVYHNTLITSDPPNGRVGATPPEAIIQTRYNNNLQISMVGMEALGVDTRGNHNYSPGDFVDFAGRDLRLASGSGAIDTGVVIPGINDGAHGSEAFLGAAPDAGAIEFGRDMWHVGHNFDTPHDATYGWTALPGTNLYDNSQFNQGIADWNVVAGTPFAADFNSWNLKENSLTGFFRTKSVEFAPGEAIDRTFTGLKPSTTYTVGAGSRVIQQVTVGDEYDGSSGGINTGNYRGEDYAWGVSGSEWIRYDDIDFGEAGQFDQIELLYARANQNDSIAGAIVEMRIDGPDGPLVAQFDKLNDDPAQTWYTRRRDFFDISGVHDVYLSVQGTNAADLGISSLRLLQETPLEADRLTMQVSSAGATTRSRQLGWTDWRLGYEVLTFTTGPAATSATVTFRNDGRINNYLDRLILVEGVVRTGDNLAYVDGIATQSSTAGGQAADNATDQDAGTRSETLATGSNNWWAVRFGASFSIGEIVLTNRDDALYQELSNFKVSVWTESPENGGTKLWEKAYFDSGSVGQGELLRISGGEVADDGVTRLGASFGRYVRVELDGLNNAGNGRLALADVSVEASSTAAPPENLAQAGVASQSSNFRFTSDLAENANNGVVTPSGDYNHTLSESQPWWQVNLRRDSDLSQIVVVNRLDAANRVGTFRVSVWDADPDDGGSELWGRNYSYNENAPAFSTTSIGPGGALIVEGDTLDGGTRLDSVTGARYVRIQKTGSGFLHLAEVQVWGSQPEVPPTTVDLNANEYDYDLGRPTSPVQVGWTPLTPITNGDISWDRPVDDGDRPGASGFGVNLINRDYVQSEERATLRHKLRNGVWRVHLNLGDPERDRDDMRVWAEGQVLAADVDSDASAQDASRFPAVIGEVEVRDGELTLEFDDLGGADPAWAATRLSLDFVENLPPAPDLDLQLLVQPNGQAVLRNTTSQPMDLIGYAISGADLTSGDWVGLTEQAYQGAGWAETTATPTSLAESGTTPITIPVGGQVLIGRIAPGGSDGLGFSYQLEGSAAKAGYLATETLGAPTLPGDFNGDLVVDAADYTLWRDRSGQAAVPFGSGDANGDGMINAADKNYWRARYGDRVQVTTLIDTAEGNGSFEDWGASSATRILVNSGVTSVPGWTAATSGVGGWLRQGDAAATAGASSDGTAYAIAGGGATLTLTSDPIAGHTTTQGEELVVALDVSSKDGATNSYTVSLVLGGQERLLGQFQAGPNASTVGPETRELSYIVPAADAGQQPVVKVVAAVPAGSFSQAYVDGVRLRSLGGGSPAVALATAASPTHTTDFEVLEPVESSNAEGFATLVPSKLVTAVRASATRRESLASATVASDLLLLSTLERAPSAAKSDEIPEAMTDSEYEEALDFAFARLANNFA